MKKIIISMIFIASCCALMAQKTKTKDQEIKTKQKDHTIMSTSSNPAYTVNVPSNVLFYFERDYPAINNETWQQSGDWYEADYNSNGYLMRVYYKINGTGYSAALPVIQTYVPPVVISKATEIYGPKVYSIKGMKTANGQDVYQLTLMENGQQSGVEWLNADGSPGTAPTRTA